MDLWVRVVILIVSFTAAIVLTIRWRRKIFRRLLHASRGSGWRALGVILLYHVVLILALFVAVVVVMSMNQGLSSGVPATVVTAFTVPILAPFTFSFLPYPGEPRLRENPLHPVHELKQLNDSASGAPPYVLGITGSIFFVFLAIFFGGGAAVPGILSF